MHVGHGCVATYAIFPFVLKMKMLYPHIEVHVNCVDYAVN